MNSDILNKIKILKKYTKSKEELEKYFNIDCDIYELIGMIKTGENRCCLESKCFDKFKKEEEDFINFLEYSNVEDGMFECMKCKSKKIFTTSKQTRRSDESTTVFALCSKCKNKWIVN